MYYRGTLEQFNTWHEVAKQAAGIPPEGKIGNVNGKPAPDNQRTIGVSDAVAHPTNNDDYVWVHGVHLDFDNFISLSKEAVEAAGFFPSEEL